MTLLNVFVDRSRTGPIAVRIQSDTAHWCGPVDCWHDSKVSIDPKSGIVLAATGRVLHAAIFRMLLRGAAFRDLDEAIEAIGCGAFPPRKIRLLFMGPETVFIIAGMWRREPSAFEISTKNWSAEAVREWAIQPAEPEDLAFWRGEGRRAGRDGEIDLLRRQARQSYRTWLFGLRQRAAAGCVEETTIRPDGPIETRVLLSSV